MLKDEEQVSEQQEKLRARVLKMKCRHGADLAHLPHPGTCLDLGCDKCYMLNLLARETQPAPPSLSTELNWEDVRRINKEVHNEMWREVMKGEHVDVWKEFTRRLNAFLAAAKSPESDYVCSRCHRAVPENCPCPYVITGERP
jgi:hypothetical protein